MRGHDSRRREAGWMESLLSLVNGVIALTRAIVAGVGFLSTQLRTRRGKVSDPPAPVRTSTAARYRIPERRRDPWRDVHASPGSFAERVAETMAARGVTPAEYSRGKRG